MRWSSRLWWAAVVGLAGLSGVVARMWWHERGDVDPASASLGLVSAALAVVSTWHARLAQRQADRDLQTWANRLAEAVVAEESVQRAQLLGGVEAIDVHFTLRSVPDGVPAGAKSEGSLEEIVDYYRGLDAPERLVITGGPGAGKTVLAVELILGLLKDPPPGSPVPVRVSAASWDLAVPVTDWLSDHLAATFAIKPAIARVLVEAGWVLPVIDGLDEMDNLPEPGYASRAGRALRALNIYQRAGERLRLVLTCRADQYDALTSHDIAARAAARIELDPVDTYQAWHFIQNMTGRQDPERWQPVQDALTRPGHVLATALASPWRLTLAVTVYSQRVDDTGAYLRDPADLASMTNEIQIRDHLLGLFIPTRIAAARAANRTAGKPADHGIPDAKQTQTWLTELATYLNANITRPPLGGRPLSNTDLVLHELWPLAARLSRVFGLLVAVTIGLVLGAILLIPIGFTLYITGIGSAVLGGMLVFFKFWNNLWPEPAHLNFSRIKTSAGLKHLVRQLAFGLAAGLAFGLIAGLTGALIAGLSVGLTAGLTGGLTGGLAGGVAIGLAGGLGSDVSSRHPRALIRADVTGWLTFGLAFGLAGGLAVGLAFGLAGGITGGFTSGLVFGLTGGLAFGLAGGLTFGLTVGFTAGLAGGLTAGLAGGIVGGMALGLTGGLANGLMVAFAGGLASGLAGGLAFGFAGGPAGVRYIGLLLATRRRLPWFLGRFLDDCYHLGLLRISGIAYQFRHRELQDYLADVCVTSP